MWKPFILLEFDVEYNFWNNHFLETSSTTENQMSDNGKITTNDVTQPSKTFTLATYKGKIFDFVVLPWMLQENRWGNTSNHRIII